MDSFKSLFGISKSQVKETCVLMPFITKIRLKEFGITGFNQGFPYSSGSNKDLTLINTKLGAPLLGDAILHLKGTSCKKLILFGSCGLVKKTSSLDIGSLVTPAKCYEMESFSQMLRMKKPSSLSYPDKSLLKLLPNIEKVTCATVGSIKLETTYKKIFNEKKIDALDMECSALFNASKEINAKPIALFYATDIITNKSPFAKRSIAEQTSINNAINKGMETIKDLLI